jgi:hypothetical protein
MVFVEPRLARHLAATRLSPAKIAPLGERRGYTHNTYLHLTARSATWLSLRAKLWGASSYCPNLDPTVWATTTPPLPADRGEVE